MQAMKKNCKISVLDYFLYIKRNQQKNKALNVFQFDIPENMHFRERTIISYFTITCTQYIITQ